MGKKMMRIQSLDELLGLENEEVSTSFTAPSDGILFLPPQAIRPFREHPFHLYEGRRLMDLTESIKENGILNPVIIRKIEPDERGYEYEMLAGHNRQHGAVMAGLEKIPCIVKENLSDRDAWIYVIETNVIQRSFMELLPSEKAAILSIRYSKVISQGKRNDIIQEIKALEDASELAEDKTCGNDFHMSRNRDNVGKEYDLTGRMVANYLRIHELVPALKQRIDSGEITLSCGVVLSYLTDKEQEMTALVLEREAGRITRQNACELRRNAGALDEGLVRQIILADEKQTAVKPEAQKPVIYRIKPDIYKKYFAEQMSQKEVDRIVDQALALYFAGGKAVK